MMSWWRCGLEWRSTLALLSPPSREDTSTTVTRGQMPAGNMRGTSCMWTSAHVTLIKSNVYRSVDCPGYANGQGQAEKDACWYEMIHSRGDEFIPLCQEYPGMMGDSAISLLNRAAFHFSSNLQQQQVYKEFWLPRLHMAFVRGTANMILKTLPTPCFTSGIPGIADNNLLMQTEPMSFLSARAQGNICA